MIRTLAWRLFTGGLWLTGPRENNPAGSMRRANAVYPLRTGSVRSRSGITQLENRAAHSLFKAFGRRIAGIGTQLWREVLGVWTQLISGVPTLDGTNLTFLTAPPTVGKDEYVFVAGAGNLFKINPALDTATKWGIDRPANTGAPTVFGGIITAPSSALGTQATKLIDEMNATTGWTATVMDEDDTDVTATFPPNLTAVTKNVVSTPASPPDASLRTRGFRDKTVRLDKNITINLNQFSAPGDSGDEDYIEFYVAIARPKHIKNFEIIFYVGAAPADKNDVAASYSREMTVVRVNKRKKRKLVGLGDFIRQKDVKKALADGRLEGASLSTAEFVGQDQLGVKRRTWTRVTVAKSSFEANGNAGQTGFTWADVTALRFSYETTKLGGSRVWIDRIRMIGGVGMQGDYQYMFTFLNNNTGTRSNPFPMRLDPVTNLPLFAPVVINNVERQPVLLGLLAGAVALPAPVDLQVTHLEIWRTVGSGTNFFLADKTASTVASPATGYTDTVADVPGLFGGGGGTKFLQPIELPDDNDRPVDLASSTTTAIEDVCGPIYGRLFMCTGVDNRVWYSAIGRMETAPSYTEVGGAQQTVARSDFPVALTLNTNEDVSRVVVWNEQVFAFTNKGVYRCVTQDEPFVFIKIVGAPGTRFPRSVAVTDAGILYQALDGIRLIDGLTSRLDDNLAPIFRGGNSDGLVNFEAVAAVFARGEYYISDATQTLAFAPEGGWRNVGAICRAFFWEEDSRVLLAAVSLSATFRICSLEGSSTGEVAGLVAEATTDNGAAIAFSIETGGADVGTQLKQPTGVWGIAQRIYVLGQTDAQSLTVELIIDNTVVSVGTISTLAGIRSQMELGIQRAGWITGVRLTGSLSTRIEISEISVDVYVPERGGG